MFTPTSLIQEDNFIFYNKGKELWGETPDFRDDLEDKFRHQLENADLLQGFTLHSDVTSGYGSLSGLIMQEMMRDEAPKAPIVLFALENKNKICEKEHP